MPSHGLTFWTAISLAQEGIANVCATVIPLPLSILQEYPAQVAITRLAIGLALLPVSVLGGGPINPIPPTFATFVSQTYGHLAEISVNTVSGSFSKCDVQDCCVADFSNAMIKLSVKCVIVIQILLVC